MSSRRAQADHGQSGWFERWVPATSAVRRLPWGDALVAVVVLATCGFLALRTVPRQTTEWPYLRADQLRIYGMACVALLGLLATARLLPRVLGWVTRGVVVLGALVLSAMSIGRARQHVTWNWPPVVRHSAQQNMPRLTGAESAEWAARVAMHVLSTSGGAGQVRVPAAWPFPDSVSVAVVRGTADSVRVWARSADGTTRCAEAPQYSDKHSERRGKGPTSEYTPCAGIAEPAASQFTPVMRDSAPMAAPMTAPASAAGVRGTDWPQYRRDASHTARADGAETEVTWDARVSGEVRSSPSIAAGLVLVGSHGTGAIAALSLHTGRIAWERRLPNWVHQDIVSDGEVAVAGFGDNENSFKGRSPSGLAAYRLADGAHLWTVFDESSVMTSPIVVDSTLLYATASGILLRRSLRTGSVIDSMQLRGGVIMAPPAMTGDTLVVALEPATVCALHARPLRTLWCDELPKVFMLGHYAPSVHDGTVYAAGSVVLQALGPGQLFDMPRHWKRRAVDALISPQFFAAGQQLFALRLRDGVHVWDGPIRGAYREVGGHPSGTAVVSGSLGAIVYPAQDSLVVFDVATGARRWAVGAGESRGPPLLLDSVVVHARRDGSIESREMASGRLRCRIAMRAGFDRSGPVVAGDIVILADVLGGVHAVPRRTLTSCPQA